MNIQNFIVMLPIKHLVFKTPTWDIARNVAQLYQSSNICDILIISMPTVYIGSLNHRQTPCGQDLPIIAMSQATTGPNARE